MRAVRLPGEKRSYRREGRFGRLQLPNRCSDRLKTPCLSCDDNFFSTTTNSPTCKVRKNGAAHLRRHRLEYWSIHELHQACTVTREIVGKCCGSATNTNRSSLLVGRPSLDLGTLGLKGHRVHYSLFIRFREPHIHRGLRSVRSVRSVAIGKC